MNQLADLRIAIMNTGKVLEIHSKVTLSLLSATAASTDGGRTYRQERHWKKQTSDDGQLFHALVLISACGMVSPNSYREYREFLVHSPMVLKMRSIMLSAARRIWS